MTTKLLDEQKRAAISSEATNATDEQKYLTFELAGSEGLSSEVAFSPDGQTVAAKTPDGVKLWNASTGKFLKLLTNTRSVRRFAFSPSSGQLATGHSGGMVKLWATDFSQPTAELKGHTGHISSVAYSKDGKMLVTADWAHTIRIWNVHQTN